MKKAEIIVDKYFLTGAVDKRIFRFILLNTWKSRVRGI